MALGSRGWLKRRRARSRRYDKLYGYAVEAKLERWRFLRRRDELATAGQLGPAHMTHDDPAPDICDGRGDSCLGCYDCNGGRERDERARSTLDQGRGANE